MSNRLMSLFVNEELLTQLGEIATVNNTSPAAEMSRAHDQYLTAQWDAHDGDFAAWSKRALVQQNELFRWQMERLRDGAAETPRPETPDLPAIAGRSFAGRQLLTVSITDEQYARFTLLGFYYGLTVGCLTEQAYVAHIKAEMLDDPAAFEARRKKTEQERERIVTQYMQEN